MRAALRRLSPRPWTTPVKIAERCQVEFEFGAHQPAQLSRARRAGQPPSILSGCAGRALHAATARHPRQEVRRARWSYELDIIEQHGLCGLLPHRVGLHPLRQAARASRWGRGGAAAPAAIAAYCLGITSIDPIKYNLLFERFLNPERVSMPDYRHRLLLRAPAGGHRLCGAQIRGGPRGPDHHLRHHGGQAASSGTWAGCWA